jgi:hypothetical protein
MLRNISTSFYKSVHEVCYICIYLPGKKKPVALAFLLRLYLIDENDDELIVTVAAQHGVELLGEWSFYDFPACIYLDLKVSNLFSKTK